MSDPDYIEVPLVVEGVRSRFLRTPKFAELISSIPAKNYNTGPERAFRRVMHLLVPDCRPGDILDVAADFQISNALGYIVEFCATLVLTPDAEGTAGLESMVSLSDGTEPARGRFITPMPGYNVTPNASTNFPYGGMHHARFPMAAKFEVPSDVTGDQYVAIISYVAGQRYDTLHSVSVDAPSGFISVLHDLRGDRS